MFTGRGWLFDQSRPLSTGRPEFGSVLRGAELHVAVGPRHDAVRHRQRVVNRRRRLLWWLCNGRTKLTTLATVDVPR